MEEKYREFKEKALKYNITNLSFSKGEFETYTDAKLRLQILGTIFITYYPNEKNKYLENYTKLSNSLNYEYVDRIEKPNDGIPDGSGANGGKKKRNKKRKTNKKRKSSRKK
jgi:hypothetical protein